MVLIYDSYIDSQKNINTAIYSQSSHLVFLPFKGFLYRKDYTWFLLLIPNTGTQIACPVRLQSPQEQAKALINRRRYIKSAGDNEGPLS